MSEISFLSEQYRSLKKLSQDLTQKVMVLKKQQLLLEKEFSNKHLDLIVNKAEIDDAWNYLNDFLEVLSEIALKENIDRENIYCTLIQKMNKEFDLFEKKLEDLFETVKRKGSLKDVHFRFLNKLLSTLDFERSKTFRKLRTTRK